MNGPVHVGVEFTPHVVRDRWRHSAFTAFAKPVLGRRNPTILTDTRVVFDGRVATGVRPFKAVNAG